MKNLDFKYAAAYNFLPFGPEGIELNFKKYKNIILVCGENRDNKAIDSEIFSSESKVSSNGTGKSSIQEIVIYGLFGKTVKRPEKLGANDVIHNKIGKDAKIELIFDDIRIIRTRKEAGKDSKNSLRLWESKDAIWDKNTEITQGTMAATQKKIEEIVGLSYESFINMCVFTDDQRACFLECENKQKKEIVENMLSLGVYRQWFDNAKNQRKEMKIKIETKAKEYNILVGNKEDAQRRLNLTKTKEQKWKEDKIKEIQNLIENAEKLTSYLAKTDNGAALIAYQQAQEKIILINNLMPEKENLRKELKEKFDFAKKKEDEVKIESQNIAENYREISQKSKYLVTERANKQSEIQNLKSNKLGSKCDKCKGEVLEENINQYVSIIETDISEINLNINELIKKGKVISTEVEKIKEKQDKIKKYILDFSSKIETLDQELDKMRKELVSASQIREPKVDNEEALHQQKIEQIKNQIKEKRKEFEGDTPFKDILENDEVELSKSINSVEQKQKEVKSLEEELPYYDYWITGFGDNGIRKWIVDGIIPDLNNRINYWLQFLVDNKITLKFDNELNETIERNPCDGDPYIYFAMSTGQKRRLNLAVSQAFAHIMSMSSGSIPSILFLDEISTNVDQAGIIGIYRIICELAEDRQVFVTTHDHELLRMLESADKLNLVLENGFTKLVD
jgi:DNA repair exonuclease SbcCD ATPase subunit